SVQGGQLPSSIESRLAYGGENDGDRPLVRGGSARANQISEFGQCCEPGSGDLSFETPIFHELAENFFFTISNGTQDGETRPPPRAVPPQDIQQSSLLFGMLEIPEGQRGLKTHACINVRRQLHHLSLQFSGSA